MNIGKTPKPPPAPKPVRMAVETDPDVVAAGNRTRLAALNRSNRLSTIMTDSLRNTVGSGRKLGA